MSVVETAETRIFDRLASAPLFHPASADLFANDWALEAGDVVTVKSGEESYSLPVFTMTLVWNGANRVYIQGTGNEEREPLPASRRSQYRGDSNQYSSLIVTKDRIFAHIEDEVNSMRSYVELTASHLQSEFYDDINSLRSYVELTASVLHSEFIDEVNSLYSYVELTASHLTEQFFDEVSSLRSYVELTASALRADFIDEGNSLRSYIELTASQLRADFINEGNSLRSYLELTASNLRTEFVDETTSLRSYIEQTASNISAVVSDVNSIKTSGLWINRDSISLLSGAITYKDDYIQDSSGNYYRYWNSSTSQYEYALAPSGYTGTRYRKEQNLHVENGVGLKIDKTVGSSVASFGVYDQNNLTAGYLISMINGQSTATIQADKINLEGYVKATDITANYLKGKIALIDQMSTGAIYCGSLNIGSSSAQIASNGDASFNRLYSVASQISTLSFDGSNYFTNCIVSASVSGNTLTLTPASGSAVTFSKATSLSGEWSGAVAAGKSYKVTATQNDTSVGTLYSPALDGITFGSKSWASDYKSFTQTFTVYDDQSEDLYQETLTIDTTPSYNAGFNNVLVSGVSVDSSYSYNGYCYATITVRLSNSETSSRTLQIAL